MPSAFALAFAALLAAAPAPLQPSLDRAVDLVFQPYSAPPAARAPAVWQRPIWSRETAALIAQWRKATPKDMTDDLGDGDWLCQCRDWDEHVFRLTLLSQKIDSAGHAIVNVGYRLNSLDYCTVRLLLNYEHGAWKLDDLFDDDFPQGLQTALRLTTAQDLRR